MSDTQLRNIVEAALLAADRPLSLADLAGLFEEAERPANAELRQALELIAGEYEARALQLAETASGWRVQVRAQFAPQVSRLWPERPQKYSRALLETLALIAYRQPITRAEIEAVRGVAVNPNIVRTLMERSWVRVVGHRDVPGRPELLGTTKEFLDYFGLRSLDQLPSLAELKAMSDLVPQLELPGTADAAGQVAATEDDLPDVAEADGDEEDLEAAADGKPGLVAAPPDAES
ncbi:MAG TPA: SMC-Scp complex subunit ScpB [Steroidobacteraceae bacterium]|nr:SMC-Scp complex subunit ScpB [Steroidobacteraceae bacterium]HQW09764.1 SMC-Scp complex subunit ScpB [Steroidobacteraceae bacterium]HQX48159.1 SMC-Scp complex subunit ScpB [Steroidobacteraceae bacterium]HQX77340.1 SMC-Scp complex subunit ScpB [Steroidobacteraceae bacterium]HQZ79767.1 SMC-Scp complex subunit ScpB [Steroidobacteraceae bacterium]